MYQVGSRKKLQKWLYLFKRLADSQQLARRYHNMEAAILLHLQQRRGVADGPVDLWVQHRRVGMVLCDVGDAGVPHYGVKKVARQTDTLQ